MKLRQVFRRFYPKKDIRQQQDNDDNDDDDSDNDKENDDEKTHLTSPISSPFHPKSSKSTTQPSPTSKNGLEPKRYSTTSEQTSTSEDHRSDDCIYPTVNSPTKSRHHKNSKYSQKSGANSKRRYIHFNFIGRLSIRRSFKKKAKREPNNASSQCNHTKLDSDTSLTLYEDRTNSSSDSHYNETPFPSNSDTFVKHALVNRTKSSKTLKSNSKEEKGDIDTSDITASIMCRETDRLSRALSLFDLHDITSSANSDGYHYEKRVAHTSILPHQEASPTKKNNYKNIPPNSMIPEYRSTRHRYCNTYHSYSQLKGLSDKSISSSSSSSSSSTAILSTLSSSAQLQEKVNAPSQSEISPQDERIEKLFKFPCPATSLHKKDNRDSWYPTVSSNNFTNSQSQTTTIANTTTDIASSSSFSSSAPTSSPLKNERVPLNRTKTIADDRKTTGILDIHTKRRQVDPRIVATDHPMKTRIDAIERTMNEMKISPRRANNKVLPAVDHSGYSVLDQSDIFRIWRPRRNIDVMHFNPANPHRHPPVFNTDLASTTTCTSAVDTANSCTIPIIDNNDDNNSSTACTFTVNSSSGISDTQYYTELEEDADDEYSTSVILSSAFVLHCYANCPPVRLPVEYDDGHDESVLNARYNSATESDSEHLYEKISGRYTDNHNVSSDSNLDELDCNASYSKRQNQSHHQERNLIAIRPDQEHIISNYEDDMSYEKIWPKPILLPYRNGRNRSFIINDSSTDYESDINDSNNFDLVTANNTSKKNDKTQNSFQRHSIILDGSLAQNLLAYSISNSNKTKNLSYNQHIMNLKNSSTKRNQLQELLGIPFIPSIRTSNKTRFFSKVKTRNNNCEKKNSKPPLTFRDKLVRRLCLFNHHTLSISSDYQPENLTYEVTQIDKTTMPIQTKNNALQPLEFDCDTQSRKPEPNNARPNNSETSNNFADLVPRRDLGHVDTVSSPITIKVNSESEFLANEMFTMVSSFNSSLESIPPSSSSSSSSSSSLLSSTLNDFDNENVDHDNFFDHQYNILPRDIVIHRSTNSNYRKSMSPENKDHRYYESQQQQQHLTEKRFGFYFDLSTDESVVEKPPGSGQQSGQTSLDPEVRLKAIWLRLDLAFLQCCRLIGEPQAVPSLLNETTVGDDVTNTESVSSGIDSQQS